MKTEITKIYDELKSIMLITIISLFFSSCQKSAINGNLDGLWQVMSVEPQSPEITSEKRFYYCFSLHTVQLTVYGTGPMLSGNILKYDNDTLTLDFPYADDNNPSTSLLKYYGINHNPVSFTIKFLDKKKMVLTDGITTITLRKF